MMAARRSALDAAEREIERHLAAGNMTDAATRALEAYGPRILGFLTAVLKDEDAAAEAYAQFSENLWKGIGRFRGECRFRTWIYQVAHNAAARHAQDPFRRRARPLPTAELAGAAAQPRDATRPYQKTTMKEALTRLRAQLDPEDQALLVLRVDQRMSWREIARVVSEPDGPFAEAALRKRFERLKARLRALAEAEGLIVDDAKE